MNRNLVAFTCSLVVLAVIIGFGARQFASPSFLLPIVMSLTVATWVVYFFMIRTTGKDFIKNYLLTIVLKLIAGGIFISILLFLDVDRANDNAILFMATYLLLTGLEVGFLFKKFGS